MRVVVLLMGVVVVSGCGRDQAPAGAGAPAAVEAPRDAQHQGVVGPHGDHTPHRGGLVLMNGDVHYEVVFARDGRHQVWFSDAMRNELPASLASNVTMEVMRPGAPVEVVTLAIDEAGESWVGSGRPIAGDDVMVKVKYALQGQPHEIELPFVVE